MSCINLPASIACKSSAASLRGSSLKTLPAKSRLVPFPSGLGALRRRRNVADVPGINVAANLHSGDLDGSNRTVQFFEIIRRHSLITIVGCERRGEIKTVSCPTRGLIEIMFFFQQRIGGDVFEDHALFFQALALFVRI